MDFKTAVSEVMGPSPSLLKRIGHAAAVVAIGLVVVAATLWFFTSISMWLIAAGAALAVVLLFAHRLHPAVKTRWFFMPGRRRFTALALLGGFLLLPGVELTWTGLAGPGTPSDMVTGLVLFAVSIACFWFVVRTFEGLAMGDVFKIVAPEHEGALLSKLRALDALHAAGSGQAADFRGLDPASVIEALKARVIGQDATIDAAVKTAFRRARLARPNKPVATLLFVGATGAGKTELAKAIADELFAGRMVRIDCNELSAEQGVQRLIGSPPGYVDSDKGGWLCRELARVGTGVLLLDEIERAHPVVVQTLMGLLDEARLTEQSTSQTYSARGFMVVMTSNAAKDEIAEVARVEKDPTLRSVKIRDALQHAGFLPEILARIDQVCAFAPLAAQDYGRVVEKFLIAFGDVVGVQVVEADGELLIDLVTKAMKSQSYGIREVVKEVEDVVTDGLLVAKDYGATAAAIRVRDGQVFVEPIAVAGDGAHRNTYGQEETT